MSKRYREKRALIRQLREHARLWQSELAEMLNVHQTMISKFEVFSRIPTKAQCRKFVEIAQKYGFKLTINKLEEDYKK